LKNEPRREAGDADIRGEPLKAEAGDRKRRVPPPFPLFVQTPFQVYRKEFSVYPKEFSVYRKKFLVDLI
jgi:hypothetical protein